MNSQWVFLTGEIQQNFKEFEYKYVLLTYKTIYIFWMFWGCGEGLELVGIVRIGSFRSGEAWVDGFSYFEMLSIV